MSTAEEERAAVQRELLEERELKIVRRLARAEDAAPRENYRASRDDDDDRRGRARRDPRVSSATASQARGIRGIYTATEKARQRVIDARTPKGPPTTTEIQAAEMLGKLDEWEAE